MEVVLSSSFVLNQQMPAPLGCVACLLPSWPTGWLDGWMDGWLMAAIKNNPHTQKSKAQTTSDPPSIAASLHNQSANDTTANTLMHPLQAWFIATQSRTHTQSLLALGFLLHLSSSPNRTSECNSGGRIALLQSAHNRTIAQSHTTIVLTDHC